MSKTKIYLLLSLMVLTVQIASASLQISLKPIGSNYFLSVDASQFPLMSADLQVLQNGSQQTADAGNVMILENNTVAKPISIGPIKNGYQTVKWYTRLRGPYYPVTFMVTLNGDYGQFTGYHNRNDISQVRITNSKNDLLTDYHYTPGSEDETISKVLYIIANSGKKDILGNEMAVHIDSVRLHTKNFQTLWLGNVFDTTSPPINSPVTFPNLCVLKYRPTTTNYFRDKFSVYYKGGQKEEVNLISGTFHVPSTDKNLKIVYPNGGESLTPCEKITIRWKGYNPTQATEIDFSSNGWEWTNIGLSWDSTLAWDVPKVLSEKCYIRARQHFYPSDPKKLGYSSTPVTNINFNTNGKKLLSCFVDASIIEWDMITLKETQPFTRYKATELTPGDRIISKGVSYTNQNDSEFAMVYYYPNSVDKRDTLAFFNIGTSAPVNKIEIDTAFKVRKMLVDPSRSVLLLIPSAGAKIKVYSLASKSFLSDLAFPSRVTALEFNSKQQSLSVALASGEVKILSLPGFSETNSLDLSYLPMITELGFSPNGNYLAVGCMVPQPTIMSGNANELHVVDIPSKQIIRTISRSGNNPVGLKFSPSSTVLLVGTASAPQLTLWDLTMGDESQMGSTMGQQGNLTDFAFSPVGSAIATSTYTSDNLIVSTFAYSESDTSDAAFSINNATMISKPIELPSQYIDQWSDTPLSSVICNSSDSKVPIILLQARMMKGLHFQLKDNFLVDTLKPGECVNLSVFYNPRDTGWVSDTIVFSSCSAEFKVPLNSYALKRNIKFYSDYFDFGNLCVGDTLIKTLTIARNMDPVPVKINKIYTVDSTKPNFRLLTTIVDSVIQPNQDIIVTVMFAPQMIDEIKTILRIEHSYLPKFAVDGILRGTGIGTDYKLSHNDLRFLPEIPVRRIAVINESKNNLMIDGFTSDPDGYYKISTPLPKEIKAMETDSIDIEWIQSKGEPAKDVKFYITANPCAATKMIYIGPYRGTSSLRFDNVEADPRFNATIPVYYNNTENSSYQGTRFFSAEFSMNPRMFLPLSITSQFGEAKITKNTVENDRRIIGIRIDGNFPISGKIADIEGVAGLAETDTCKIEFLSTSEYWGKNISVDTKPGIFRLVNVFNNRYIEKRSLTALLIAPNPATADAEIVFHTTNDLPCTVEVFDYLGNRACDPISLKPLAGKNSVNFNGEKLNSGIYSVIVRQSDSVLSGTLEIIK